VVKNDTGAAALPNATGLFDMLPRSLLQTLVSVTLLGAVLFAVIQQAGLSNLSQTALDTPAGPVLLAVCGLMVGVLLAAARVKLVADDLGYELKWRDALSALGLSQLGGAAFFHLAGQLIARSAYLSRRGIPVGASVLMVGYERLLALGISLLLAAFGAWHLFGKIAVDLDNGGVPLAKLVAGLLLAVAGGAWLGWGRLAASHIRQRLGRGVAWRIARVGLVSLGIQLATASAYVMIASALAPEVAMLDLIAASFVVMLAAAVPISLAGWGVREFSAMLALGAVGVSADAAFLTAVLIGGGALIAVAPLAMLGLTGKTVAPPPKPRDQTPVDFNSLASIITSLIVATAVFFQLYVPTTSGQLNVNLADPFAMLGGVLFLVLFVLRADDLPQWRLPYFNTHILAAVAIITIALVIGAVRHGWTDWALFNKFGGWFVLLGYAASGALIVKAMGERGLRMVLMTFVATGLAIAVLELILLTARGAGVEISLQLLWQDPQGFSHNRNAFAFQMLMVISCIIALSLPRTLTVLLLAVALTTVWATASRAGFGALVVVLVLALSVRAISPKTLFTAFCASFVLVMVVVVLAEAKFARLVAMAPSGSDRWESIFGGLQLFRAHPFLGSGLGSFIYDEIKAGRPPLVIHSTPIWILAEMGLVGLLVFTAPIVRIFWREFRHARSDISRYLLIMMIGGFGTMSLVHEMLYQRTFWLLLGIAMVTPVFAGRHGQPEQTPS
jgi:hypothetical protein